MPGFEKMISEICTFEKLPHIFFSKVFNDEIIIYQKEGNLYAVSGFCPHFGGPLKVESDKLHCFWHDWKFDLVTHQCINRKVNITLQSYGVELISRTRVLINYAA